MSDKLTKRPMPSDVFGSDIPFVRQEGWDDPNTQQRALTDLTKQAHRLEIYERYTSLPIQAKFRVLYLSEMELREAYSSLFAEYQTLVRKLQDIIGAQNTTINALVDGLATLEERMPKPQEEGQLSLELEGEPKMDWPHG
jgi:uncharacterized membrane protein YccC